MTDLDTQLAALLDRVSDEDRELCQEIADDAKRVALKALEGDDVTEELAHLKAQTAAMAEVARGVVHDAIANWLRENGAKILSTVLAVV